MKISINPSEPLFSLICENIDLRQELNALKSGNCKVKNFKVDNCNIEFLTHKDELQDIKNILHQNNEISDEVTARKNRDSLEQEALFQLEEIIADLRKEISCHELENNKLTVYIETLEKENAQFKTALLTQEDKDNA